jgi:hypothetical protein
VTFKEVYVKQGEEKAEGDKETPAPTEEKKEEAPAAPVA